MKDIESTINRLQQMLLIESNDKGYWSGELSSSALSTATAVFALASVDKILHASSINSGINWLIKNRNPDGGWGDTAISKSNLSTTLLVYSAMPVISPDQDVLNACEKYIKGIAGSIDPNDIARSILTAYGSDRTFSYPILTMCALAGRLGKDGWKYVNGLPFELAVLPSSGSNG
jgi:squalene-hopene/tetraprenyl-beta-curcumene cyclase